MTDRRRTNRFVIPDYSHGTFRVMQDVYVERVDADHVFVLSDHPLRTGEELMLELPAALGIRAILTVTVTSCGRVRTGDTPRYRAVTRSAEPLELPRAMTHTGRRVPSRQPVLPAIGVLIRRMAVHIRDVSTSGCQLESHEALTEGAVGQLEMFVDGDVHREPLRICRTGCTTGSAWPWRSGAHFLSIDAPAPASVRNVVARFEIIDELARNGSTRRRSLQPLV